MRIENIEAGCIVLTIVHSPLVLRLPVETAV